MWGGDIGWRSMGACSWQGYGTSVGGLTFALTWLMSGGRGGGHFPFEACI